MPELPEVETTARSLREHLVGRRAIAAGGVDWPRMLPNSTAEEISALLGQHAVVAVDRRGKYLLLEFEGGLTLGVHRKMSGNLLLVPKTTQAYPHTHFVLDFDEDQQLRLVDMRKFGRVYLFRIAGRAGRVPRRPTRPGTAGQRARRPHPASPIGTTHGADQDRRCSTRPCSPASATSTPTRRSGRPASIRSSQPTAFPCR